MGEEGSDEEREVERGREGKRARDREGEKERDIYYKIIFNFIAVVLKFQINTCITLKRIARKTQCCNSFLS